MPRIEIPEAYEEIIDAITDAQVGIDALESARHLALARTSLQQAMLWLLKDAIADALEADGLDEAKAGDTGASSDDEGVSPDAS